MKNNITLDITSHTNSDLVLPDQAALIHWIGSALQFSYTDIIINLLLCDKAEITTLNINFRSKNKATNVLSFPAENTPNLIGDIALCLPVVQEEAVQLNIPEMHHFAHLFIHGVLHLQGFDHIEDDEAEIMEDLEKKILLTIFPKTH